MLRVVNVAFCFLKWVVKVHPDTGFSPEADQRSVVSPHYCNRPSRCLGKDITLPPDCAFDRPRGAEEGEGGNCVKGGAEQAADP